MLVSDKELKNLKLGSLPVPLLKQLAHENGFVITKKKTADLMKECVESVTLTDALIDQFIRKNYLENVIRRQSDIINDTELVAELNKVTSVRWGTVQGELDRKIQAEYVRKTPRYEDLLEKIRTVLHGEVTNYVTTAWYNHWSTILIEDHISAHPRVVPTLKNSKGIDIFFDGQPFDLKVTYLPKKYKGTPQEVVADPEKLAIWMYENQGAERFGNDNRLFVILVDTDKPEESWKLKRNFRRIFDYLDKFLDQESVSTKDEIVFEFGKKTHTAITKVLLVTQR